MPTPLICTQCGAHLPQNGTVCEYCDTAFAVPKQKPAPKPKETVSDVLRGPEMERLIATVTRQHENAKKLSTPKLPVIAQTYASTVEHLLQALNLVRKSADSTIANQRAATNQWVSAATNNLAAAKQLAQVHDNPNIKKQAVAAAESQLSMAKKFAANFK